MKSEASRPASEGPKKKRKHGPGSKARSHRARPTPKWLLAKKDMDEMAQRRCVMVLEVLSGAKPVTDAIAETGISRGTYYKLEERALRAMLAALSPAAGPDGTEGAGLDAALAKVAELEGRLAEMEKEKRRTDRLGLAIRKLVKPGPVTTGAGRPPGRKRTSSSTRSGPNGSPASTVTMATTTGTSAPDSSPTLAGTAAR